MEKLSQYSWPGNVRELRNVLERALIITRSGELHAENMLLPEPRARGMLESSHRPGKLLDVLREMERTMILDALALNNGKIQAAADRLGITRHSLKRRMQKFGFS